MPHISHCNVCITLSKFLFIIKLSCEEPAGTSNLGNFKKCQKWKPTAY